MNETHPEPVRVHLVADSTRTPPAPPRPRRRTVRYRTVVLSAAQPVAVVAGTEPLREGLIVQASGNNDVYLADSEQAALAVVRAGSGGGLDTACLIPHANTAPTAFTSTEQVWAAAIAYPASLSVMIISLESP